MSYTIYYYLEISGTGPNCKETKAKLLDYLKVTGYIECYNRWAKNIFEWSREEVGGLSLLFPEWEFKVTSIGEDYLMSHKCGYVNISQTLYKNGHISENKFILEESKVWEKNDDANSDLVQDNYDNSLEEQRARENEAELKKSALNKLTPEEKQILGL